MGSLWGYNLYHRNQFPLLRYVFAAFGIGKPRSIRGVVVGDFLVYLFCLLGLDFFDELSRYSRPDGVGLYDRIREHQSICRHDSSFAHDGVIEHYGTHSYQNIIFDDGAVYHCIVPDRDEILVFACL